MLAIEYNSGGILDKIDASLLFCFAKNPYTIVCGFLLIHYYLFTIHYKVFCVRIFVCKVVKKLSAERVQIAKQCATTLLKPLTFHPIFDILLFTEPPAYTGFSVFSGVRATASASIG